MQRPSIYQTLKAPALMHLNGGLPAAIAGGIQPGSSDPDDMLMADAVKGMTDTQRYEWLGNQIDRTIHDMDAKGIKIDRSRILDSNFDDSINDDARVRHSGDSYHNTVYVHAPMYQMSVRDLRTVLAHELTHTQQPYSANPDEIARFEQQADHNAAQTYGAQATIDMLERLAKVSHVDPEKHIPGDTHESYRDRERRIQKDFPAEHAVIPGGSSSKAAPQSKHVPPAISLLQDHSSL